MAAAAAAIYAHVHEATQPSHPRDVRGRSKKQGKVIDALIFSLPAILGAIYYKRRDSVDELIKKTFQIVLNKATELKLLKM